MLNSLLILASFSVSVGVASIAVTQFAEDLSPSNSVDLIVITDRSRSIGTERYFQSTKSFIRDLLNQYISSGDGNIRGALLSFGGSDVTVVYNDIKMSSASTTKDGNTYPTKCAALKTYINTTLTVGEGNKMRESLSKAKDIFHLADTRNARKMLLWVTDGNFQKNEDPSDAIRNLKNLGVDIYICGLGQYAIDNPAVMKNFSSKSRRGGLPLYAPFSDVETKDKGEETWSSLLKKDYLASYVSSQNRNVSNFAPTYVKDEASTCNSPCHAHSECQCDILRGVSQCMCFPGYYEVDHSCTRCPDNTFKSETGNQACTKCPTSCDTCQGSSEVRISVDQCGCGSKCQDPCDGKTCGHNEACRAVDGECACLDGWTGAGCSVNRNDCADNLCQNGATCLDMVNDYACICPWGFLGRFCEINFDECSYDLCSKYTINCIDLVNKFKCNCTNPNDKSLFCTDNEITSTKSAYTTTAFTSVDPKLPTITTAGAATAATTTLTPPTGSSSATDETSAPTTSTKNDDTTTSTATDPNTSSDVTTNGGIVTGTSHKPTAGPVKNSGTDKKIYIIIAAVALALIIFAIVIVCCLMARRKNHREDDKSAVAIYESGVTADLPRNPDGTVEKNFYGLWKKNTIKGISEVYPYQSNGTRNLAYTSDGVEGDNRGLNRINEIYMNNADTTVSTPANMTTVGPDKDVMEGWKTYLSQLTDKNVVESAIIVKPDGSSRAKTDSWIINHSEIKKLTAILDEQQVNVAAHAQCCEFHITYNEEGCSAGGRSFDGLLCLRICRTNDYLLAAVCVSGNDTDQQCRKELEWIADHIKAEGY